MNTTRLKNFARAARTKLLQEVSGRLDQVLHTEGLEQIEKQEPIRRLRMELDRHGREQLVERVAYTWFNRLIAFRFMDMNGYTGVRVVSPLGEGHLPQLLQEAKGGHIDQDLPVDKARIMGILNHEIPSSNPQNEVYKMLLVGECNRWHGKMPFLFERINDYTELLMPEDLISNNSILHDIREAMPQEDCQEVEIIGWLYQFYISEKKDEVFASKKKVRKEDIPAATAIFTPRWIVEYMVQNTLGKLWLQNNPDSNLRDHMPYFIESASLKADEYLKVDSVEEITLLDQACGSGHILVYAFDLLTKIYEEQGYTTAVIPSLIINKNLYGFEIDERAAQLSGISLLMKARAYHRTFFEQDEIPVPQITCFHDLKLTDSEIAQTLDQAQVKPSAALTHDFTLIRQSTNYGSLIQPHSQMLELENVLRKVEIVAIESDVFKQRMLDEVNKAISQIILLKKKHHCVVDNPPYMGFGNMNKELSGFVKQQYPKSKKDLMATFMQSGLMATTKKGYLGMINQQSWMFLGSYESLREELIYTIFIDTLLHLGSRTFPEIGGEVVQNVAFTFCNSKLNQKGRYIRLVDFDNSDIKRNKLKEAIENPDCQWHYQFNQQDFKKIPGSPISYHLSSKYIDAFRSNISLGNLANPKLGLQTGDNDRFIRYWYEIPVSKFSQFYESSPKWYPHSKGGERRKWFGNMEFVVNWGNDGEEIWQDKKDKLEAGLIISGNSGCWNSEYYLREGATWTRMAGGSINVRYQPEGHVFDTASPTIFTEDDFFLVLMGLLNSKVCNAFVSALNPTLSFQSGDLKRIPVINTNNFNSQLVEFLISLSRKEWNTRELSWDFTRSGLLITNAKYLAESYHHYCKYLRDIFLGIYSHENKLNQLFIEIYGLQDELNPNVQLEDITVLKEEAFIENEKLVFRSEVIVAQFINYIVGCMMGRYSLDKEGLILANQGETLDDYIKKIQDSNSKFQSIDDLSFVPDDDAIIPILEGKWFNDDIVARFEQFLKASFGEEHFTENLAFVEECLGKDTRTYFIRDFYKDHVKRYKKRPIYWLFSSPEGYFNALIYLHRYRPDTCSKILNDYLRPFINKLQSHQRSLEGQLLQSGLSGTEKTRINKEISYAKKALQDCIAYEKDILYPIATKRIDINLDDGVLVNYNKFGKAVADVPGLNDAKAKKKVREFDWIDTSTIID